MAGTRVEADITGRDTDDAGVWQFNNPNDLKI